MPDLFYLCSNALERHSLSLFRATRLGAQGVITSDAPSTGFAASIVPISSVPLRFALVAGAGASVAVGARRVCGASPLADGDRLFVERHEFLLSLDSLPLPVESPQDARCPVCERIPVETGPAGDARQLACPRCGARACADCWCDFRGGVCLTPHCEQPAALERALFRPAPTDFLDLASGEPTSLAPS
jgi:hypothetical protein